MTLLKRIFATTELRDDPPVLVDVGAAGGVTPIWRRIAPYAIGVGFEPDARDAARLNADQQIFRRWVYCAGLVAPEAKDGYKEFFLTRSPHCSSLLRPRTVALQEWCFADFFAVDRVTSVPAVTLEGALEANGIRRIDWLKCDTQGLDLSLFLSLPVDWRRAILAVEFEPGLIDAYEGEDKFWHTLRAMEAEPFWIAELDVAGTARGRKPMLQEELGGWSERWLPRFAPTAPAYVNVRYLRSIGGVGGELDRRGLLLSWVVADLIGQHGQAVMVAREGRGRYGDELFEAMLATSRRRLQLAMLRRFPRWLWRRLGLPG